MGKRLADATALRAGIGIGAGLLAVAAAAAAVWHIRTVLTVIFLAGFAAIGADRIVQLLTRRGLPRPWAIAALIVTGNLAACGLLAVAVPPLAAQAEALITQAPDIIEQVLDHRPLTDTGVTEAVSSWLTPHNLAALAGGLLGGAATAVGFLLTLGAAALLSLFILAALPRLTRAITGLYPANRRAELARLTAGVLDRIGAYLAGSLGIAAIAGTTALIFMWIAGIPYPLILALIVALFDLIPQIGATLAAVVVTVVALSESLPLAIITIIFFIVYQQTENWLIYPRVMKHAVHISNLAALIAVMIGAALFGVVGVLLAVPGYATCQLIIRHYLTAAPHTTTT